MESAVAHIEWVLFLSSANSVIFYRFIFHNFIFLSAPDVNNMSPWELNKTEVHESEWATVLILTLVGRELIF
jgi:hypothetical protein